MRRFWIAAFIPLLAVSLLGCTTPKENAAAQNGQGGETSESAPAAVTSEDLSALQEIRDERLTFKDNDAYAPYDGAVRIDPEKAGDGYRVGNRTVEIVKAGTYVFSGTFAGQLRIAAGDKDDVRVVLENAEIRNESGAAIYAENADLVVLSVPEGTVSVLADGTASADAGAVAASCDLAVNGTGTLRITGNAKDGVNTKDDLRVLGTTLEVTAADDGLTANDGILLQDVALTVTAQGDGVKASKAEADKGFIQVDGGTYTITAENDGMDAATCLCLLDGAFSVTTGGGAENGAQKTGQNTFGGPAQTETDTPSAKGLKAGARLDVRGGTYALDTADDALHSNGILYYAGGETSLRTGDDAAHADDALTFSGGKLTASACYEGLEAGTLVISGGEVQITASDDGLNAAGGADGASAFGRFGRDAFAADASKSITISGGAVMVDAAGDGIDSNGSVTMTGGAVYVSGPTDSANGIFDFGTTFEISGGTLLGTGSAGMLQTPTGAQGVVAINVSGNAGSAVEVTDSAGNTLCAATAPKAFQVVVCSADAIKTGETYSVRLNGTEAGSGVCGENIQSGFGDRGFGGRGGPGGRMPGGEVPGSGETPGGDVPQMPDGQMPDGQPPEGQTPEVPGELPFGNGPQIPGGQNINL